jgi:predicted nucleic acid-binding protein
VPTNERKELLELLSRGGIAAEDPQLSPEVQSLDPDDDYLIALASISRAVLVSGDMNLLALSEEIPVYTQAEFVALIVASS